MNIKRQAEVFADYFAAEAVEMSENMLLDEADEYKSFTVVEDIMANAIDSMTEACLEEYLEEFCKEVREVLKRTKVITVSANFNKDGLDSVVVARKVTE